MFRFAFALAFALGIVSTAANASSIRVDGDYAVSGPALYGWGLNVEAWDRTPHFDFHLDTHEHKTVKLFKIWTNEWYVNYDDKHWESLNVHFSFDSLDTSGTVEGYSRGFKNHYGQYGYVGWDNPLEIALEHGGMLLVSLTHEVFNWGKHHLNAGYHYGSYVYANFKYKPGDKVEPIPLPGALPLMATALGLFGVAAWRRRKTA
ncbi:MAG: VPLPA-CTERM sorting domain-containing protein [Pseudomonadota bacterium]